ncbi:hypothetical protein [Nocardia sp.]|uniref:hypothetical protein n=1 Tax=Nocardia sp. TaxID=1821 RepID=UPI002618A434|nr:hypothetical protein [Nocardia sp.]
MNLFAGGTTEFAVPVPDLEATVILKASLGENGSQTRASLIWLRCSKSFISTAEIRTYRLADIMLSGARWDAVAALAILISNTEAELDTESRALS